MRCHCRLPGQHDVGCPLAGTKCRGCGHALSRHRYYIRGGTNRHGAHIVCSVDNCAWTECLDPDALERMKEEMR